MEEIYFRKRKRYRVKTLNRGDVFVAEIFDNIFVYGQVINPYINNEYNELFNGNVVVVFYQIVTKGIDIEFYSNCNKKVLTSPKIILEKVSFNNGALKLIGINEAVPKISYGFYITRWNEKKKRNIMIKRWIDENFKIKFLKPKYLAAYSLFTEYGMELSVQRGIEKYNKVLQVNDNKIREILI